MSLLKKMTSLESRALQFAVNHHEGQFRKYSNEPYITHPKAVAEIVRSVGHNEIMIAAALLHDVVEDTSASLQDVYREFGGEVSALVEMLTDVSSPEDGNRAHRKAMDRNHSAKASPSAMTIKLADLIHNAEDILSQKDRSAVKFASIFIDEKVLLLKVLSGGDPVLWLRASKIAIYYLEGSGRSHKEIASDIVSNHLNSICESTLEDSIVKALQEESDIKDEIHSISLNF